ncbi:unnamed protein product [Linum trigynum]|uniref:Uncharacterized protein n=1 Tax=Linum trigynum TaxID=586398 RepID=A0AAV2D760_9ROSI
MGPCAGGQASTGPWAGLGGGNDERERGAWTIHKPNNYTMAMQLNDNIVKQQKENCMACNITYKDPKFEIGNENFNQVYPDVHHFIVVGLWQQEQSWQTMM